MNEEKQIELLNAFKEDIIADIRSKIREVHPRDVILSESELQKTTKKMVDELSIILKNTKEHEC